MLLWEFVGHRRACLPARRVHRVFAEWVDGGSLAGAVREQRIYATAVQGVLCRDLDIAIQCCSPNSRRQERGTAWAPRVRPMCGPRR